MSTIVTRAGKGSPLTFTELDANFTNLNADKLEQSGDTMTGKLVLVTGATGAASATVPHGAAPTTPVNGDIWSTTSGFFFRQNGTTVQFADLSSTQTLAGKTLTNPLLNGKRTALTTRTAAYTATTSDHTILCNATTAAFSVTLPTAVGNTGQMYSIKKIDASANAVTVATTAAQTIDGAATRSLASQWSSVTVQSDGANWVVI
ncbi:MAG: hypothetical protein ACO29V_02805 [Limnohabitans sp.]